MSPSASDYSLSTELWRYINSSYLLTYIIYLLTDTAEAVQNEITHSDSDWRPDSCGEAVVAVGGADFEDRLDNSAYDASEPADEGTGEWAENVASGSSEAGASGWLDNGLKNVDTNNDQWNGASDGLLSVDRHSHRFTASVVVNTGNKERCKFIIS